MARRNLRATLTSQTNNLTVRSGSAPTNRLDNLADVVELDSQKVDGAILVYDADADRYVLRDILTYDLDSGAYKLDGGDF